MTDDAQAKAIIEAALLATEKPLTLEELKIALEEKSSGEIRKIVSQLKEEYVTQQRGIRIIEVAGGFQMGTDPAWAERLKGIRRKVRVARLSKPSLETLAIIAYRQPVTRPEIEQIRGVDVDGVIKSLLERHLIQIVGRKPGVGRPLLYGTSQEFLERFGLNSVQEMPQLSEGGEIPPMEEVATTEASPESEPTETTSTRGQDE
jgi:segregation and condensation protein B